MNREKTGGQLCRGCGAVSTRGANLRSQGFRGGGAVTGFQPPIAIEMIRGTVAYRTCSQMGTTTAGRPKTSRNTSPSVPRHRPTLRGLGARSRQPRSAQGHQLGLDHKQLFVRSQGLDFASRASRKPGSSGSCWFRKVLAAGRRYPVVCIVRAATSHKIPFARICLAAANESA